MIRKYNHPHPTVRCAVCLYALGIGYDRIARCIFGTNKRKNKIATWLKNRRLPTLFKIPRCKPKKIVVKPQRDYEAYLQKQSHHRLKKHLRRKVWIYFKYGLHPKSTQSLIGCTRDKFRSHIERQFRDGMTFDNYASVWELDHIKPCASFNLFDPYQRLTAFHFTNFQPLGVTQNRCKSAKVVGQLNLKL